MKIDLSEGKYVLAVSGGVDSMVLLDILHQKAGVELIVAHFNHGIRQDSALDEKLVKETAENHNLPVENGHGKLDKGTSEDTARKARYEFLELVLKKHKAKAIITAHHQDDLIETALLNLLRGTKRKGLTSIFSSKIVRPLLKTPKSEILAYAKQHQIKWREDSTNEDEKYLRNYIRQNILAKLSPSDREKLLKNLENTAKLNQAIDVEIAIISQMVTDNGKIDRKKFTMLSADVANEVLLYWLKSKDVTQLPKQMIFSLTSFVKTGKIGSRQDVKQGQGIILDRKFATWG